MDSGELNGTVVLNEFLPGIELFWPGGFSGFSGGNFGNFDPSGFDAARQADFELTSQAVELANAINASSGNPVGQAELAAIVNQAIAQGSPTVSILDSIINGVVGTVQALPAIAGAIATGAGAIQAIQQSLSGNPTLPMPVVAMGMASATMINGAVAPGASDGTAAFAAACSLDPTCSANLAAALNGGVATSAMMNGGGMGGAMDMIDVQLAALGFPPALIQIIKSTPGAVARFLGPAAVAVGAAGTGAALTGLLTTGMTTTKFPRRIQIPDGKGGVREYVSRGRPILYSGDITAARRVTRVASRARRGRPRSRSLGQRVMMIQSGAVEVCGKCRTGPCACA